MRIHIIAALSCVVLLLATSLVGAEQTKALDLQLDHSSRSEKEQMRDQHRMPAETLAFFGLKSDMRVIELFPGGGWYTKLLGPYLEKDGTLYIALGTEDLVPKLSELGLSKVIATGDMQNFDRTDAPGYIFSIDSIDFQQENVDMVLTFRNAHNLNSEARTKLNRAAFSALKAGGIYGVIDHNRRHMEGLKKATWRRTDPVQIIAEAGAVGFKFVGYSTLHARPEDTLEHDSRHESLVNESDRYTLKFRKPDAASSH